jgi:hypothetical protein
MGQLTSKVEVALATYLASVVAFPNIYTGESSGDKMMSEMICSCSDGDEEPPFSGNFWTPFEVLVRSEFSTDVDQVDPKIAHDALAENVYNAIAVSDLPALLNAAGGPIGSGITVMGFDKFSLKSDPRDDVWESTISGRLYCCPSTLPS